jgi:plasmid stabilization system protein ParE
MIIRYGAQAIADIEDIFQFLRERSPSGAENVLRAIYAGILLIAEQPGAAPQTDMPSVRVKIVRRYHYKIFYGVKGNEIPIIHVRHGARAPWP